MWTSRLVARSSDHGCLVSDSCSSGRGFASRFLQTPPRDGALALRWHFASIRLCRGLTPPSCQTCPAHNLSAPRKGNGTGRMRPMLRRRPRARSRGDHRQRAAWTADDRCQVEELMVRWRHNDAALESLGPQEQRPRSRIRRRLRTPPDPVPLDLRAARARPRRRHRPPRPTIAPRRWPPPSASGPAGSFFRGLSAMPRLRFPPSGSAPRRTGWRRMER